MRYYSDNHVWVEADQGAATLGISRHAAAELGEITFVELPRVGMHVAPGDVLCVVESVKTAADVLCPVHGVVHEVNRRLVEDPGLVNLSPEGEGWICRLGDIVAHDLAGLLTQGRYDAFVLADEER